MEVKESIREEYSLYLCTFCGRYYVKKISNLSYKYKKLCYTKTGNLRWREEYEL